MARREAGFVETDGKRLAASVLEKIMTIRCRVSIDNDPKNVDCTFQAIPRVGEIVAMRIDGETRDLRVSRVVHRPDGGDDDDAAVTIEVTSSLL